MTTEIQMVKRIQNITGKKFSTCLFCLRANRGNFQKALELCSDAAEDGRRS